MSNDLRRRLVTGLTAFLLAACAVALLATVRVADPFPVRAARQIAFDLLQRAAPRTPLDAPVMIVEIDEASLARFGQWPWRRDLLAELTDRLHAAGAATVVYDLIFAEPDRLSPSRLAEDPRLRPVLPPDALAALPDTDRLFAEAMARGFVVIGFGSVPGAGALPPVKAGFAYTGASPVPYLPRLEGATRLVPALAEAARGVGSVSLGPGISLGVVRRLPLLWTDGERLYPSLAAEALRVAQGAQTHIVFASPEAGGVQSVRIGAFEAPTEPTGELYLHFAPVGSVPYVSAARVFDDAELRALVPAIQGRIVLVGTSAAGLFDLRHTPLGEAVPGVEVHAQAIAQIINGQYLRRHDWTRGLELLALAVAVVTVGLATLRAGALVSLVLGAGIAAGIVAGAWAGFTRWGVLIDPSFALLSGIGVWSLATAFRYLVTDRQRRQIRDAFSHYVHPSVLREIERQHRRLRLGGEIRELTVLFTDVRDFTRLSEQLTPEELVAFLNTLLGRLAGEITREGGVVDKYIGDSVMAFWNAPIDQPDHARRACRAALAMRRAVEELNATRALALPEPLAAGAGVAIGVGLNTGPACVGNIGSTERLEYSAIGDAVNVAARAESASKAVGYDLVATRAVAEQAPDFAFVEAGALALKGKSAPVPLVLLVGDPAVKSSRAFVAFEARFRQLLAALSAGDIAAADAATADCRSLAPALDARLLDFLDRLPARAADFRPPPPRLGLVEG